MVVRKHNPRDYSLHKHEVIRPDWEHITFECFSYDPTFTKIYAPQLNNLTNLSNCVKTSWNSLSCYRSKDLKEDMIVKIPVNILEAGEYRVDILYEQSSYLCKRVDKKYAKRDTGNDLLGSVDLISNNTVVVQNNINKTVLNVTFVDGTKGTYEIDTDVFNETELIAGYTYNNPVRMSIVSDGGLVKPVMVDNNSNPSVKIISSDNSFSNVVRKDKDIRVAFDGENNFLKRKTLFFEETLGEKTLEIHIPYNCYFYGAVIRKIKRYWGDNLDSAGTNIAFTEASMSISEMTNSTELSLTVLYDNAFETNLTESGLFFEYANECNLIVKNDKGDEEVIFGGYLSSAVPNDKKTELEIHCADRLVDGQNRHILDELVLQEGTKSLSENEYQTSYEKSFKTYGGLLKYLCDIHEITLNSNIHKNYLIEGEKYQKGIIIKFNKKNAPKKMSATKDCTLKKNKNSILLRNKKDGTKKQVWTLYDASKNAKKPIEFTDYPYFHITYGLGEAKKEHTTKTTETVSNGTAGATSFTKCGVSKDGKYVMGIGNRGVGRGSSQYPYNQLYKSIFVNKCPYCGKATLRWDSARSNTKCIYTAKWNGTKRNWGGGIPETEITCNSCDCDFDVPTGYSKEGKYKYKLKKVSTVKSSKAEQDLLHNGKMEAVTNKEKISSDDIFKAITELASQYDYVNGKKGQTYSQMKKTGHGDCWGFSDLISHELKRYKVNHKIVRYGTGSSSEHRTVLYQNEKGKYVDFPYAEYNWASKIKNGGSLYPTSKSKTAKAYYKYKSGGRIDQAKFSSSTTSTETSELKTITGYDKDNPFQAYIKITYSLQADYTSKKYHIYLDFTQSAKSNYKVTGLNTYWINDATRKSTSKNIVSLLKSIHGEDSKFFLQMIQFIAPKIKKEDENTDTNWFTYDKSTHDEASRKMDLYQIVFNDNNTPNPKELNSCGKTINDLMKEIVDESGYLVDMVYGHHRCDDIINFRVNNNINPVFYAVEGDNNNILEWGDIKYSPVSDLFNRSISVFKGDDGVYHYVDTRDYESIFLYGEKTTLQTSTDPIGAKEAYFNAINSDKYNPHNEYNYTITVPNYPDIKLGDLVQVIANNSKLSTIKTVESVSINYNVKNIPRIQTTIGLGELAPDLQLQKTMRLLRQSAKKETTWFSSTAIPIDDEEIYEWDN